MRSSMDAEIPCPCHVCGYEVDVSRQEAGVAVFVSSVRECRAASDPVHVADCMIGGIVLVAVVAQGSIAEQKMRSQGRRRTMILGS